MAHKEKRNKKEGQSQAKQVSSEKNPFPVKKTIFIGLAVLLTAALVYAGRLVYLSVINPAAAFEVPLASAAASPSASASQSKQSITQADLDFIADKKNILLVGVDETEKRELTREGFRSDVMLLLCIDFKENSVHMLSIPRDSYWPIYNTSGKWKINAAFMHGGGIAGQGFDYCMKTVSDLLGDIPVDYYVGIEMNTLRTIVDELGGIDYNVDIPIQLEGRTLETGMQHLNGQQALDYCRARKGISTDIGRTDRQQKMLLALFKKMQTADNKLEIIPGLFTKLKDELYTNLSMEQILALTIFATKLDTGAIQRHTLDGEYMIAYGTKFYVLYQSKKAKVINDIFHIDINTSGDTKYDLSYVRADSLARDALKEASSTLSKYKKKITADQKSRINSLVSQVTGQRKKLPSGTSALRSLAQKLLNECAAVAKEIKAAKEKPPPSESDSAEESASTSPSASAPADSTDPAGSTDPAETSG